MDQVDLMDIDLENSNQSALSNDALVTEDSVAGKSTPTLKVGYRLFAKMQGKDEMVMGEIKAIEQISENPPTFRYYIHFVDYNRRMETWLREDSMDLTRVFYPKRLTKKDKDNIAQLSPDDEGNRKKRGVIRGVGTSNIEYVPFNEIERQDEVETPAARRARKKDEEDETKRRNIELIVLNGFTIVPWYFAPYPASLTKLPAVFLCNWCLSYWGNFDSLKYHMSCCPLTGPPGKKIYEHDGLAFFEVDGADDNVYAVNLCLLAKLFLDHKTVYYDTKPFYFYVLCERTEDEYNIVGYFSKEKCSADEYNLACILVLPQFQQKGYGKYLIEFSYLLSKVEQKTGSPEKPLSDLGLLSYRSYWLYAITEFVVGHYDSRNCEDIKKYLSKEINLRCNLLQLVEKTRIKRDDLVSTMESFGIAQHTNAGNVKIALSLSMIKKYFEDKAGRRHVDQKYLKWQPPQVKDDVPSGSRAADDKRRVGALEDED